MAMSTTLQEAVLDEDHEAINAELSKSRKPSQRVLDDALALAIPRCSLETIRLILQLGAKLDVVAVSKAIERADPAVFQALMESGWDINSTEFGRSAVQ
jgi:hypothetical protein